MEKLKEIEELRMIVADDSRAIEILEKICRENSKNRRQRILGRVLLLIGGICTCCGIIAGVITKNEYIIFCTFLLATLSLCYAAGCINDFFRFNAKKIISNDQLLFLNAILKEKTMTSVGVYPIIQKEKQLFIEDNGILEYIGETEEEIKTECEKLRYKKIKDFEDLFYPRYQILSCSEIKY